MPAQHQKSIVCTAGRPTNMSTGTNAESPLWIYISRGGVGPTLIDVSINHACFAVFAGSIPVEIPLVCGSCAFQSKAINLHPDSSCHTYALRFTLLAFRTASIVFATCIITSFFWLVGHQQSTSPTPSSLPFKTLTVAGYCRSYTWISLILGLSTAVASCAPSTTSICRVGASSHLSYPFWRNVPGDSVLSCCHAAPIFIHDWH
jgi:hypothetical protein